MEHLAEIKFIEAHHNVSPIEVALLLSKQPLLNKAFILSQINGIQKAKDKLPAFYATPNIIYPTKLSLEQCSSEKTGVYKSKLIKGKTLVDLTGGFGVDSFYFSKMYHQVTYIEPNETLCNTVKHNFGLLKVNNVCMINTTAENFIKANTQQFDVVYIDPSRRDQNKRVFKLEECTPNIVALAPKLFQFSGKILLKTAPLLDIKQTLRDLKNVAEVWIISVNNDCKEVLYLLEKEFFSTPQINTINLGNKNQKFSFSYPREQKTIANFSPPLKYLYEPNSALLKGGAFNSICETYNVSKIAQHSHLYTAKNLVEEFPGRRFEIKHIVPYSTKEIKKLGVFKANVSCRNFKNTVAQVKQKLKLKDGGTTYLFATTNMDDKPILIVCDKI